MLTVINPDKTISSPFFVSLINYLAKTESVSLRMIKKEFSEVNHLERQLENFIQAGYIRRANKRYANQFLVCQSIEEIALDDTLIVDTQTLCYQQLHEIRFETRLENQTNRVLISEKTDFMREKATLSNYFYRLERGYPLSEEQKPLYHILGDVNKDYALKYMTTFLLKFLKKESVKQKRPDIFVQSLEQLGYLKKTEDGYQLKLELDKENLTFFAKI